MQRVAIFAFNRLINLFYTSNFSTDNHALIKKGWTSFLRLPRKVTATNNVVAMYLYYYKWLTTAAKIICNWSNRVCDSFVRDIINLSVLIIITTHPSVLSILVHPQVNCLYTCRSMLIFIAIIDTVCQWQRTCT